MTCTAALFHLGCLLIVGASCCCQCWFSLSVWVCSGHSHFVLHLVIPGSIQIGCLSLFVFLSLFVASSLGCFVWLHLWLGPKCWICEDLYCMLFIYVIVDSINCCCDYKLIFYSNCVGSVGIVAEAMTSNEFPADWTMQSTLQLLLQFYK